MPEPLPDHPSPPFPAFDLPPWGTEGAPEVEPAGEGEAPARGGLVVTTLSSIPGGTRLLGIVTGVGTARINGDPEPAAEQAVAAALARLEEGAARLGATAVAGVGLSPAIRKRRVVVVATGTALRPG